MNNTIWDIKLTQDEIVALIEDGEFSEEDAKENLEMVEKMISDKFDSIVYVNDNLNADIVALNTKIKELQEKVKKKEKQLKHFNDYVLMGMKALGKKEIKHSTGKVTIRIDKVVKVLNIDDVPKEFIKTKEIIEKNVDKMSVKKFLKDNPKKDIKGVELIDNEKLSFK